MINYILLWVSIGLNYYLIWRLYRALKREHASLGIIKTMLKERTQTKPKRSPMYQEWDNHGATPV